MEIQEWLNKPNATRNLDDETFAALLPQLAEQLSNVDYHFYYTEQELKEDWKKLLAYSKTDTITASQTRPGMKLCEFFFPNFYDIQSPSGKCFKQFWNAQDLQKVIKWNRSSHSTPYLSEMKRGVNFCYGLTKNTMYRPHLAKTICKHYDAQTVFDPCCGWGGRMLGAVAAGARYIGCEPNTETYQNLTKLAAFLGIENQVKLFNSPAEEINLSPLSYDLVLTSPPYYNLEVYSSEDTQSENRYNSYADWLKQWFEPLVLSTAAKAKTVCWNIADVGKITLQKDFIALMSQQPEWQENTIFGIGSSARQANQNELKNKKNIDKTLVYVRKEL